MTFKEKHLLPLMLAATMVAGCNRGKPFIKDDNGERLGLLDERPLKDVDKYNTPIVLYQVEVPLYKKDGSRYSEMYMLTRALQQSKYTSRQSLEEMSVKQVYINGSKEPCYVKADENNAIYTKRGFSGLFIDKNKSAVVISDDNVSRFVIEITNFRESQKARRSYRRETIKPLEIPNPVDSVKTDSIKADSLKADSVVSDTILDTTQRNKTFTEKQFMDTLLTSGQREG